MTTKAQYTPAPWDIAGSTADSWFYVHGANKVCELPKPSGYYQSPAEREANARLIAAAPELLESASDQIHWLRNYLTQLVHVPTKDGNGHIVNGFAAAQIPDWAIRQKLHDLEAVCKKARGQ